MKKVLDDIKKLPPEEQLGAFAALIKEVADAMKVEGAEVKAAHIIAAETRERRERPRDA